MAPRLCPTMPGIARSLDLCLGSEACCPCLCFPTRPDTCPRARPLRGMQWRVLSRIAREEGPHALLRGWQPRVLFHAPSAAICWGIYETAKKVLGSGA